MKKIQVILGVIAFVLAVGAALVTLAKPAPNTVAYRYVDNPGSVPDQCISVQIDCQLTPTAQACKVGSGPILREVNNPAAGTLCGQEMFLIIP